jgi:ElaB/YqjD/DUF883 family membrane-anchored ribosome-binding protein
MPRANLFLANGDDAACRDCSPVYLLVRGGMMNTELTASHSNVEGKKDRLVKDLKGVVVDADDLLKEVANYTAEEFSAARTKIEGKLGEVRCRIADARIAVTEKARGAANTTQEYARENPWKVLGVVAAAGLAISFLLSRSNSGR